MAARLRLATLARLGAADATGAVLELASGHSVRLNPAAAQILALCDGTRSAGEIAARSRLGREQDTLDFLATALELGWIVVHA